MEDGAIRETKEEAGLDVVLGPLVGVYTRPHVGIVLVVYEGTSETDEAVAADHESMRVEWVLPREIPWAELAFETTEAALRDWLNRERT